MQPLKTHLCDLPHDTIISVSDTVPLNIDFVSASCKKVFGDQVELKLFKYPQDILDAIKECPADILGLGHFSWNNTLFVRDRSTSYAIST